MGNKDSENIKILSDPAKCEMDDSYFDLANNEHPWIQWRFDTICTVLPDNFNWGNLLDVGCGNCIALEQVRNAFGVNGKGCDLNLRALESGVYSAGLKFFYDVQDRRTEFKYHFDAVLLLDVLEHIDNPVEFLEAVNFHLRPGAAIIINVPAMPTLYSAYDSMQGHVKRYNLAELRRELREADFEVGTIGYWGFTLIPIAFVRKLVMFILGKQASYKTGFQVPGLLGSIILKILRRFDNSIGHQQFAGTSIIAIAYKSGK